MTEAVAEREANRRGMPRLLGQQSAGLENVGKNLTTLVSSDSAVMFKAPCLNCCSYRSRGVLC